jgi:hypothetical protein
MAVYALLAPYEKKFLRRFKLKNSAVVRVLQIGFTFMLVCFAWIFFRAETLDEGWYVVSHMFSGLVMIPRLLVSLTHLANAGQGETLFKPFTFNVSLGDHILAMIGLLVLLAVELPKNLAETRMGHAFQKHTVFRWVVYWFVAMSILALGVIAQTEFVYFRF